MLLQQQVDKLQADTHAEVQQRLVCTLRVQVSQLGGKLWCAGYWIDIENVSEENVYCHGIRATWEFQSRTSVWQPYILSQYTFAPHKTVSIRLSGQKQRVVFDNSDSRDVVRNTLKKAGKKQTLPIKADVQFLIYSKGNPYNDVSKYVEDAPGTIMWTGNDTYKDGRNGNSITAFNGD